MTDDVRQRAPGGTAEEVLFRYLAGRGSVGARGLLIKHGFEDVRDSTPDRRYSDGLHAVDIEAGYGMTPVLGGVSLGVGPGGFLGIVGANGAGKTTLMKALFGQVPLTRGRIYWDGERIDHLPTWARVRRGIVHVPEGRHVYPDLTVDENLQLGGLRIRRERKRLRAQRDQALALFPRLSQRLRQQAGTMSGGEQQMLAIARGIMAAPRLMLLDEISLGLSPKLTDEVGDALVGINSLGIAMILVEHRTWLLERGVERVCFLGRGTVAWEGSVEEALEEGRVSDFYLASHG